MIISDYAIRRRTTVFVIMFLSMVTGVYAYLTLPREAAPDVTIPFIMVMTLNRGVGPADIESTITRHMEEELEGIEDVKKMMSISGEGISHVVLEFHPSADIDDVLRKVKDRVDRAKGDLPREANDPIVSEINASEFPIMVINIFGEVSPDRERNLMVLKKVADDLKDLFEMVPGVLEVKRVGGLTPEVRIEIDPNLLAAYRIPPALLVARYMGEDVKISAGSADFGDQSFDLRVPMEFERDISSARNIVITKKGEKAVYLGDLAEIVPGFETEKSLSRFNGVESVSLVVQKKSGANILHIAKGINYVLDEARKSGRIPSAIKIEVTNDMAEFIQMIVDDLDNNILTGFLLVLVVVLAALGLRNSFFVALASGPQRRPCWAHARWPGPSSPPRSRRWQPSGLCFCGTASWANSWGTSPSRSSSASPRRSSWPWSSILRSAPLSCA
jgi:multidrug efflux pump subunit AcrB